MRYPSALLACFLLFPKKDIDEFLEKQEEEGWWELEATECEIWEVLDLMGVEREGKEG